MVEATRILAHRGAPDAVELSWLIPALPLLGAVVLLLFGKRIKRLAGPLATLMMFGAFAVGLWTLLQVLDRPATGRGFVEPLYTWITAGTFKVAADIRIDPLSLTMVLVVTGVGALIHLYSIGYMDGDPREPRYFAYLNLFAFSMLTLVLANNFLVLYVGWELVGLCSYLLIGFWFERPSASVAAKKAFITNRVGDVSFAIGIILIFLTFGSLDYDVVFGSAPSLLGAGTATAIALLLFGGAMGKSAQIPLYVWLPDAMEGPTPVSALIHAATMVTAGVYMVARAQAIFSLSPAAQDVVVWIGVATALLAAVIAFAQDDIKRILAYSTISQLGFMFVGVGVGAATAGMFHLVTHAFFKALMFLGAGSVMHALANETDITRMGGLARKIPWTAGTFVIGWLAIIGFPGTSGFFSKDQILEGAYNSGRTAVWLLLVAATVGTGFSMSRLVFLTFFGKSRLGSHQHPHESPAVMVVPLLALAAAAAVGGLLGPGAESGRIHKFIGATVATAGSAPTTVFEVTAEAVPAGTPDEGVERTERTETLAPFPHRDGGLSAVALSVIATLAGLVGAAAAGWFYLLGRVDWQRRRERAGFAWRAARNKFYVDEAYQFVFTSLGRLGATALTYVVDARWIDGAVNGVGDLFGKAAAAGRKVQTGFVRSYALAVLGGAILVLGVLVGRA